MEGLKTKRSQSVLEYILVSLAFATAGFLVFISTNKGIFLEKRGDSSNYQEKLVGKILEDNTAGDYIVDNSLEDKEIVELDETYIGFGQILNNE